MLSITDGDTIRVDRGHGSEPVRYIGINAPEPKDPGGSEATTRNAANGSSGRMKPFWRPMFARIGSTAPARPAARRIQPGCLGDLQLIKDGVAEAVAYPPDTKISATFVSAQAFAKSQKVGVWGLLGGPAATPKATRKPGGGGGSNCHDSYRPCLPITGDLDCADVRAMGLAPVRVVGPDDYRLDADNDGFGCD